MPVPTSDLSPLGVPLLDAQHDALERQLAVIRDAVRAHRAPDLSAVLDGIRECTSQHFASEEAFMARTGYPAYDAHRAAHREFMDWLARFEDVYARDGASPQLAVDVERWIAAWICEHQTYDLHVAAHARQVGLLDTPLRS